MEEVRVAIVDDHKLFRQGVASLITKSEGLRTVLEAEHGQHLLDQMEETAVDVVLLDLEMPVLDGMATVEVLRRKYPEVRIIILTMYDEERMITYLMEQGVHSYLLKDTEREELARAIGDVMEKGFYFNDFVVQVMRMGLQTKQRKVPSLRTEIKLTKREQEVLELIAQELTAPEIAEKLFLSPRTVEGHRENLMLKLGAKNSAGLILKAVKEGLIQP